MLFMPLLLTLTTNLRRGRATRVLLGVGLAVAILLSSRELFPAGGMHLDGFDYLPDDPGPAGMQAAYYQDRGVEGSTAGTVPMIQSELVHDPYLRLFLPYRPRAHNQLLPRFCPALRAASGRRALAVARPQGAAAGEAVLRCMAQLQPVRLNGRPLAPRYHFYTLPGTGIRGVVAFIPVAGLPRGENLLEVARLPPVDSTANRARPPFAIPFWL
jgi:hypothetical protein